MATCIAVIAAPISLPQNRLSEDELLLLDNSQKKRPSVHFAALISEFVPLLKELIYGSVDTGTVLFAVGQYVYS